MKTKSKAKARSLTPSEINKVLRRCLLMSNPELKRAALAVSLSTLRVSELSQILISDLLLPTGEIKTELPLRAALCKRKRPSTCQIDLEHLARNCPKKS